MMISDISVLVPAVGFRPVPDAAGVQIAPEMMRTAKHAAWAHGSEVLAQKTPKARK
jgi:hypothetical protein